MRSDGEFQRWMAARGGVSHASDLREAGFTTHGVRRALASGQAHWVRRSWLAVPGADPQLERAASLGARLTCVTEAARQGAWTPTHTECHVSVPGTASRVPAEGLRLHWGRAPMPVAIGELVEPPVNMLAHVAVCVSLADALCVWESAIRKKIVEPGMLQAVAWRGDARTLAALASDLSDSGLETRLMLLLRRLGLPARQQVWIDGHPVDALIGERLVVQVDGFEHHRSADRRRDLRADARLVLMGYTVLRFDYVQILFHAEEVAAAIAMAVAQGRHVPPRR